MESSVPFIFRQQCSTRSSIQEWSEFVLDVNFSFALGSASLFYPAQASSVRKGGFILINGFPCKVVHMSTAKTGKHGGAKIHFTAVDIFTGKKMEAIEGSTANVEVPNVSRTEYTLIDISDDFLSLMDGDGATRQDIRTPDNLRNELKQKFEQGINLFVTVTSAMGQEVAQEYRETAKTA